MTPAINARSIAIHVGLLQIGMMLGCQCSLDDTVAYWRLCSQIGAALLVILSIYPWLDITSWLRASVAEIRPNVEYLPCGSANTCRTVESRGSSEVDEAPEPSSATCSMGAFSISSCRRFRKDSDMDTALVLSSQELFASNEDTANLSVRDMTSIFRYVFMVNTKDFDSVVYRSSMSSQANNIITSMEVAVSASRGSTVEMDQVVANASHDSSHMDVLYFLAAVRIFADWRCARFVPEGYRRYQMSVSLGRRDLIQNIEKVERAVHVWIEATQLKSYPENNSVVSGSEDQRLISPTVGQLLQYEVETGVHKNLPSVTEASAGNGMLWITRQLSYHSSMVRKSLQVPSIYATTCAAVEAAYEDVYASYHGWTTQQIFRRSLQGAPEFTEIMKLLEEDQRDQQEVSNTTPVVLVESCETPVRRKRPRVTHTTCATTPETLAKSPVENFLQGIRSDWEKAVVQLSRFNCHDFSNPKYPSNNGPLHLVDFDRNFQKFPVMRVESDVSDSSTQDLTVSSSESDESCPVSFLEQDFADHGKELGEVILRGIPDLMDELNMNDPGKI